MSDDITELQAFETIARFVHNEGQNCIMDGNPCPDIVSVLAMVERLSRRRGYDSPVIAALVDDLDTHNTECIQTLREYGDHDHGY
ncbi:MAG: hypothetical protein VXW65_14900 [Pseudomonadota bacterium]|nr:hypothetical protein [Pseudomonadota bacterium]